MGLNAQLAYWCQRNWRPWDYWYRELPEATGSPPARHQMALRLGDAFLGGMNSASPGAAVWIKRRSDIWQHL